MYKKYNFKEDRMSEFSESKTPYFGLRDFLFYLVPGAIVLLGALIFWGTLPNWISSSSSFAPLAISVLISYYLGHAIYPLNYPIRKLFVHRGKKNVCDKKKHPYCTESCEDFKNSYMNAFKQGSGFFVSEALRHRSLARFSSAMIFPSLWLTFAFLFSYKGVTLTSIILGPIIIVIIGLAITYGFYTRYNHYQQEFLWFVKNCQPCCSPPPPSTPTTLNN
jgi:hypothetical protein